MVKEMLKTVEDAEIRSLEIVKAAQEKAQVIIDVANSKAKEALKNAKNEANALIIKGNEKDSEEFKNILSQNEDIALKQIQTVKQNAKAKQSAAVEQVVSYIYDK